MAVGLPVVGLATTELVTVIRDGESGFLDTDPAKLVAPMRDLLRDPGLAGRVGESARRVALERFGIERFARDWERTFADVIGRPAGRSPAVAAGGV
jgi:glycosyltransferase involved in cell wall biosynthesis